MATTEHADIPPKLAEATTTVSATPIASHYVQHNLHAQAREAPSKARRWWLWARKSATEEVQDNYDKRFTGQWTYTMHGRVRYPGKPNVSDLESVGLKDQPFTTEGNTDYSGGVTVKQPDGKYAYTNEFHMISYKFDDVAVYLSPTRTAPRRLVVQATDHVLDSPSLQGGDWIRTKLSGNVPLVLRLSEWALSPMREQSAVQKIKAVLRMLVVALPVQIMMAVPGLSAWDDEEWSDTYTDFPGYHWNWPKYAVNALDMRPESECKSEGSLPAAIDYRQRSTRPRRLIVKTESDWVLREFGEDADEDYPSYIFISYVWSHFPKPVETPKLKRFAAEIAESKGCTAFWFDEECAVQRNGAETDYDIYTMADTVRGCSGVAILLADNSLKSRQEWGTRMWTLPEGLLAPGQSLLLYYEDKTTGKLLCHRRSKVELTGRLWGSSSSRTGTTQGDVATRLLAEHFSGLLTLSRLELLPAAITALRARVTSSDHTGADLAFAAMGLLHYRIPKPETPKSSREGQDETILFESLARLSLQNDSDQIIERMLCLLPTTDPKPKAIFETLSTPDQFGTLVHHVLPLCEVVGVCDEPQTVMIDNCRAMHIRWKDFPRPVTERNESLRKIFSTIFVTAGLVWVGWGLQLTLAYLPFLARIVDAKSKTNLIVWIVGCFLLVGVLLSVMSPLAVRTMFGGVVLKSSPELVGFEGVLPIKQLEKLVFGHGLRSGNALSYAPSSSPLAREWRDKRERIGVEPDWVRNPNTMLEGVPSAHRLFTLVDMGERTVSIFAAERPPTVALLCGREGGMLRAVLCSWRFENDCLYKETVVRMSSSVYEAATPKGWLKMCLKTQNQSQPKRGR